MFLIWCAAFAAAGITAGSGTPVVIATTSIWADIVDQIDCADHFDVEALIPRGADAHSFEPSMHDRGALTEAALVVANGGGLEALLDDTLDAVADDGTPVVRVFDHVAEGGHADGGHADGGHADGDDPHVWFDPTLIAEAATVIADELVAAGADAAAMRACLDEFRGAVDALDAEVADILSVVPRDRRLLVTNHEALGYFADRYGFSIVGSIVPGTSTLAEASPAELERLSAEIESTGAPAVFAEASASTDVASALADDLGVDVVTLYTESLGDEASGAATYAELMRYDATAIADALAPS
jgi:zinc/manganese transport system substrate-binding protein